MIVLAFDPGLDGGAALLEASLTDRPPRPRLLQVWDMPTRPKGSGSGSGPRREVDPDGVGRLIEGVSYDVAVYEAVGPAPGQQGQFAFGRALGLLEGSLAAFNRGPAIGVAPSVWKAALKLPGGSAAKRKSVEMARRLWPDVEIRHDGHAEAALIGAYWIVSCGRDLCFR